VRFGFLKNSRVNRNEEVPYKEFLNLKTFGFGDNISKAK
jgi:hypothetical protein